MQVLKKTNMNMASADSDKRARSGRRTTFAAFFALASSFFACGSGETSTLDAASDRQVAGDYKGTERLPDKQTSDGRKIDIAVIKDSSTDGFKDVTYIEAGTSCTPTGSNCSNYPNKITKLIILEKGQIAIVGQQYVSNLWYIEVTNIVVELEKAKAGDICPVKSKSVTLIFAPLNAPKKPEFPGLTEGKEGCITVEPDCFSAEITKIQIDVSPSDGSDCPYSAKVHFAVTYSVEKK